jgi:hypothetical protein
MLAKNLFLNLDQSHRQNLAPTCYRDSVGKTVIVSLFRSATAA